MKKLYRLFAYIMAIIVSLTCTGLIPIVSAATSPKITAVKILTYPNKTEFVQGTDWDYGYYDMPEGGGLGTFVPLEGLITFKYHGGYYTRYADRGMIDMRGLVVKITYSDGSTRTESFKETVSGVQVTQNIYASPKKEYALGSNVIEVYFKSNMKARDTYTINIVTKPIKGDVNYDNKINSADALLVLQHVVGITTLSKDAFNRGDMDSNGKVNSYDALQILYKAVGA